MSNDSIDDKLIVRFSKSLVKYKWDYLKYFGLGAVAFIRFFSNGIDLTAIKIIDISFILILILWVWGSYKSDSEKKELKKENEELKEVSEKLNAEQEDHFRTKQHCKESVQDLCNQYLGQLVNDELEFTAFERISVYFHRDEEFRIIARYSEHPTFKKTNRFKFPEDEGCIHEAWTHQDGFHESRELPSYEENPEDYLQMLDEEYNINREVAERIRMKSRYYFANVVRDRKQHRCGVIVIESLDPNKFNLVTLQRICRNNNELLVELIELNRRLDPILTN